MRKYFCVLVVILFVMTGCFNKSKDEQKVEFDSHLTSDFLNSKFVSNVFDKGYKDGFVELSTKNHYFDTSVYKENELGSVFAIRSNDSLTLCFDYSNAHGEYIIVDSCFTASIYYLTDIQNTYPEGEYYGTSITPRLIRNKLVLRHANFNVGDTLYGYFEMETSKFRYRNHLDSDMYKGFFFAVIGTERPFYHIP